MRLLESELTNTTPSGVESAHDTTDRDGAPSSSISKLVLSRRRDYCDVGGNGCGIDMISSPFTYKKREKERRFQQQQRMKKMMIGKDPRNRLDGVPYVPSESDFMLFDVTSLPTPTPPPTPTPSQTMTAVRAHGHTLSPSSNLWSNTIKHRKAGDNDEDETCTTAATGPTTAATIYHSPPSSPKLRLRTQPEQIEMSPASSRKEDDHHRHRRNEISSHQSKNRIEDELLTCMTIQVTCPSRVSRPRTTKSILASATTEAHDASSTTTASIFSTTATTKSLSISSTENNNRSNKSNNKKETTESRRKKGKLAKEQRSRQQKSSN